MHTWSVQNWLVYFMFQVVMKVHQKTCQYLGRGIRNKTMVAFWNSEFTTKNYYKLALSVNEANRSLLQDCRNSRAEYTQSSSGISWSVTVALSSPTALSWGAKDQNSFNAKVGLTWGSLSAIHQSTRQIGNCALLFRYYTLAAQRKWHQGDILK